MSVSASIGPVSGINYGSLITGLTATDQAAIDAITTQTNTLTQQSNALTSLATLLTGLKVSAASFISPAIFNAATATSANPSVVSATAGVGTPVGNYSFNVQQLASASQQVTQGFASTNTALGLSGTVTLQTGGGNLNNIASLSSLNGGNGVARGSIRITDAAGDSTLVDLSHAVSLNDVINDINSSTGVDVSAAIKGDSLVLTDTSSGSGALTVSNAGGTTTASDLGISGSATSGTLTGTSLTALSSSTSLNSLNDGNGVSTAGILNDFSLTGSGGSVNVSLSGAQTVGDVIKDINKAGQSIGISAAISSSGTGITLTDSGGGPINVTALNGSLAAYDLGLQNPSTGGTLVGDRIASTLQGPLLRDLNGGYQGQSGAVVPKYGTIVINGQSVDLSSARSLNDVISAINNSGTGVTAALNKAATGITLSSSAASFTVADGTGNLASYLHLAGTSTAAATGSQISSGNLRLQYISQDTLLSTLNAGNGFKSGSVVLTDGNGNSQTINLSGSNITTVGSVINAINSAGLAISASINSTGDGILLTQTGGTGTAKIADANGTGTAASLGLAGGFTNNQLNGSFQQSITINSTDTLSSIASKINNLKVGVAASIINDGSGATPYRLNLSSKNSGVAGSLIFDGSGAGLTTTQLVQGQNASIVYGGNANGTGGLTSTSASNTITGLVPSLTLNLAGVGSTSVSVTNDTSQIASAVQTFVTNYNQVITTIASDTTFDPNNATNNGVLFGSSIVQQVQNALGRFATQSYTVGGSLTGLSSIGISVQQDGTLNLDTSQLNQVLATDPQDVQALFTTNTPAVTGGQQTISASTTLSSLTGTTFAPGKFTITDGFGTAHTIDLTTATTIGDVLSDINAGTGNTVTASINSAATGIQLTQVGGSGNASVAEAGGSTAASLNLLGTLTNGTLNQPFPPTLAKTAASGIGITLSNMIDTFNNGQTGLIFQTTDSMSTQETQLQTRQTMLNALLVAKKNTLVQQFANLEMTIANLQSQGNALSSMTTTTSTSSSKSSSS